MLLLAGLGAKAQIGGLADGSLAPDFTATDINGNTHHLQEYLDQGKTVVLYISATWCGPCWQFHNRHILSDVYGAFGQGGSEDVVVLYVEGDGGTTQADLEGTGPNTQGNWIEGTPYPIIDNAVISGASMYKINYFPTIYRICPGEAGAQGITTQIPTTTTPSQFLKNVEDGCHELEGFANYGKVESFNTRFCGEASTVSGSLLNYGGDINSATANLKADGEVIATKTFNFDEALEAFEATEITFDEIEVSGDADYQIELTNVNGGTPHNTTPEYTLTEEFSVTPNASVTSTQNVKITIHTDSNPSQMRIQIYDEADYSQPVVSYTYANTGSKKNKTFEYYESLNANTCYSLYITDSQGNGWTNGTTGVYGMKIETGVGGEGSSVIYQNDGNIGAGGLIQALFNTNDVLGNDDFAADAFAVYPNPSSGIFAFTTPETIDVTVLDVTGKVVHTAKGIENGGTINLSTLQTGLYVAQIKGQTTNRTEKLIIK